MLTEVAVLGTGSLAETVAAAHDDGRSMRRVKTIRECAAGTAGGEVLSAVVLITDRSNVPLQKAVHEVAASSGIPWLPVHLDSGWVTIGPLVRPGVPGCPLCVRRRQNRNRDDDRARQVLHRQLLTAGDRVHDPVIAPLLAAAVAGLVAAELAATFEPATRQGPTAPAPGSAAPRTEGAVLRLSVVDGSVRRHRFLPDPSCPRCADLPADTADGAVLRRRRLLKPGPEDFRLASLTDRAAQLRDRYVDPETGLIGSVGAGRLGGIPTVVARLAPARVVGDGQHGYGRAVDFRSAEVTAVAEALERRGGEHPLGRRTTVRGSYAQLGDRAVDPRLFGTPEPEQYRLPGHPFRPFDPERELSWVWGHSFARDRPVLVPEAQAYYGSRDPADPGWAFETSNGCAVGSCLTEAVLHGLLEVAERDSFLMTWYARLAVPRVDLMSAVDRRIPMTAESIEQRLGYQVSVFSTMLEQRVPTFLALALNQSSTAQPELAVAAAAHLVPERAVLSALWELTALLSGLRAGFDPAAVAPMLDDSMLVRDMADHVALHTHPSARARVGFLTDGERPVQALGAIADQARWPRHDDLSDDLSELAGRYVAGGMDVIAVDTTSTEQVAGSFTSAKVLVTGAVPMTFGHQFRRTANLPRLFTVPRLLGYRDEDLRQEDLNPYPHPFP